MIYLIKKGVDVKTAFYVMEDVRNGKGIRNDYREKLVSCGIEE
jgi:DNA polymerase III alpha subunit (gram-positive type)